MGVNHHSAWNTVRRSKQNISGLATNTWQLLAGLAVFGLLCLQISDAVAEHWRGKPRGEVFKRKTIPISVVTKKDQ